MISTIEVANEIKMHRTFPHFETYRLFEDSVFSQDDDAYDTISSSDDRTDDDDDDGEMSFILSSSSSCLVLISTLFASLDTVYFLCLL